MHEPISREWENHLLFRDYLIRHPEMAKGYAAVKMELAQRFMDDRAAYTAGKAVFIAQARHRARLEEAQWPMRRL
jgi:GrpB-like predicted nucleotidyltransferase (UPF0157 family)